ncbi:hypothetical protein [Pannonibacter sp. SL95]|uniref:hypothetical protein n=1 Tax=Pannonibacter sp. SL95 TaxID=2995153 RepID=UPI002272DB35|nr:hypothetical protein [Pannonibacter sp. SL95]MCY1708362.1 hypothetical protein [Pannonibacter sp. SL95]
MTTPSSVPAAGTKEPQPGTSEVPAQPVQQPQPVQEQPVQPAQPAQPAPQPAPQQEQPKPAEQPHPEQVEQQKQDRGPLKSYAKYDDPSAQTVVHLLQEAKVDPNVAQAIFATAFETGDLSKVDQNMLIANVGADRAALIVANATQAFNNANAKVERETKAVHEAVGGEANFATIRDWAHRVEAADPKAKTKINEIRELIDRGGNFAVLGAQELYRMYNADPNNVGTGAGALIIGTNTAGTDQTPLSRADYLKAVKEAQAKGDERAVAQLRARRAAGRTAGI